MNALQIRDAALGMVSALRAAGLEPLSVYIGKEQLQALMAFAAEQGRFVDMGEARSFIGLPFYLVNAESHLAVAP